MRSGPAAGLRGRGTMPQPEGGRRSRQQPRSLTGHCQQEKQIPCHQICDFKANRKSGFFYCCFPMFECWQVIQIIGPTLKANPNRSKGQIKGSYFQLVDLRSRPLRDLGLPAGSQLAVSAGSGKTPQHLPLASPAIMWLFRCRYVKGFLEIGIYLFSISQEHFDMT